MMTQEELDALPDMTPRIDVEERIVDGRKVLVPIVTGAFALFTAEADGLFVTSDGTVWMTGWIDGVRVKQRTTR